MVITIVIPAPGHSKCDKDQTTVGKKGKCRIRNHYVVPTPRSTHTRIRKVLLPFGSLHSPLPTTHKQPPPQPPTQMNPPANEPSHQTPNPSNFGVTPT
uniref:HDC12211 n=1 Tax=Drosophila melanogaster TaxID=7227 RepID=Q6IKK1_DROME|nr:TPA_inf: HDC12211 [Drosophila melanogaster]